MEGVFPSSPAAPPFAYGDVVVLSTIFPSDHLAQLTDQHVVHAVKRITGKKSAAHPSLTKRESEAVVVRGVVVKGILNLRR